MYKVELPSDLDIYSMVRVPITIGVIGVLGKAEEKTVVKKETYFRLVNHLQGQLERVCQKKYIERDIVLVTPAWGFADHMPISLFLMQIVKELKLVLPTKMVGGKFTKPKNTKGKKGFKSTTLKKLSDDWTDTDSANYYHNLFSEIMGKDTRLGIQEAINKGAKIVEPRIATVFHNMHLDYLFVYSYQKTNRRLQRELDSSKAVKLIFDIDLI